MTTASGARIPVVAAPRNAVELCATFDLIAAATPPLDPSLKLLEKHVPGIEAIYHLLKSKGAGQTCRVISEDAEIDGWELVLRTVLEKVIDGGIGAILSCIPARLAFFEGEGERLLLARWI